MGSPLPPSPMDGIPNPLIYAPPGVDDRGLPESGTKWPMRPYDQAYKQMQLWNAWYASDLPTLQLLYIQRNNAVVGNIGWFGRIQRFFWGRPDFQGSPRLHVPVAADLARSSSDLLFAEPMTITLNADETGDRDKAAARLETVFGGDDTIATLTEAAELSSALGGVYLRLWWDSSISDQVMLGLVAADGAVPEWRYNHLAAVTFWTVVARDNDTWVRHLERHEPGRILHGLYEGDEGTLGKRIPLTESPATAWVAAQGRQDGIIPTGINRLTATYIPNVKPNRVWRNKPGLAMLGRSDFDGIEALFDQLDAAYSSWMRDIELGRARLFIDDQLMKDMGPGKGAIFDTEQSIFTPVAGSPRSMISDSGGLGIQANQFAIRWMEHSQTVAELLNCILRGAGISTGSFSDTALTVGVPTATEIRSRDNLSERTRAKKVNYWKAGLTPLAWTAMQLDAKVFPKAGVNLECPPTITFPSRTMQSPFEMAQTISALRAVHALSLKQAIIDYRPTWTDDQIDAEVEACMREEAAASTVNVTPPEEDFGQENEQDQEDQPDFPDHPDN